MGKLLVWIMILGSVASSVAAQKRSDPFFFIQLSDPQLGFIDNNRSYTRETELMELFTDAINRLRPAFVVVTGDMVHDLNDAGQVAEFDRLIARIDPAIPVYFTPGNHDVGNEARDRLVEAYIKKYGYDRFAFAHRGAYLIGLNTPVVWADCPDRERKQWRWLAAKLKRSRRYGRTIVLGHHPFFSNRPMRRTVTKISRPFAAESTSTCSRGTAWTVTCPGTCISALRVRLGACDSIPPGPPVGRWATTVPDSGS